MTRVRRTVLAPPTRPGHAGVEHPSWPGGIWLPRSWMAVLGWICRLCCQVLRALAPSCGGSATSPASHRLSGCCVCLGLSCAGWSPGRCCGAGSPAQHGGAAELCVRRIWPCVTQLTGSDRRKTLSQRVCIVGLSQERGSWVPQLRTRFLNPRPVLGRWQKGTGHHQQPKFLSFLLWAGVVQVVGSGRVLHSQAGSASAELPALPGLAWAGPFLLQG